MVKIKLKKLKFIKKLNVFYYTKTINVKILIAKFKISIIIIVKINYHSYLFKL